MNQPKKGQKTAKVLVGINTTASQVNHSENNLKLNLGNFALKLVKLGNFAPKLLDPDR